MRSGVGELRDATLLKHVLAWQALGLLLMAAHVVLSAESLLLYPLIVGFIGWLYYRAPLAGVIVFFQVLIYQNLIISVYSSNLDPTQFTALQGTNFVLLAVLGAVSALRLWPRRRDYKAITSAMLLALALAVIYLGIGAARSGPTSALIYFRQYTGPLLAALVGLDVGRVWGFRTVGMGFVYSAVASLLISVFEFCFPLEFYTIINAVRYYQLKYWLQPEQNTFYVPEDIVKHFTAVFFNVTGEDASSVSSFRFGGTILHSISNGYIISIVGLTAFAVRRAAWLVLVWPLLILEGVKGASILLAVGLLMWFFWAMARDLKLTAVFGLLLATAYVTSGIYIGMRDMDYHVLGFLGGVHSLTDNPIGHGLGVGGNLSTQVDAGMKWEGPGGFRSAGVEFALESAVGVLFYQMGVASVAILAVFVTLLFKAPFGASKLRARPLRSDILYFALGFITLNGIFQEEAFSPYASGLIMLLCGVLISNARRQGMAVSAAEMAHTRLQTSLVRVKHLVG